MAGEIKTLKENNTQIIPKTKVDAVLNSSEQPIQNDIDNIDGEFQEAKAGLDEICGFTTTDIAKGLEDIQQAKSDIRTAIINKGIEVPFATPFEEYSQKVDQIETEMVNENPDDPEVISYIQRDYTSFENSEVTKLRSYAFYDCSSLTNASFPNCSSIGNSAFAYCTSLTNASFPNCTAIGDYTFYYCTSLTNVSFPNCSYIRNRTFYCCSLLASISFPNCSYIENYAFYGCSLLASISFPNCSYIENYAFGDCSSLTNIYLTSTSMVILETSWAFSGCTNLQNIYVNSSLIDTYKANSVWSWYTDKIKGY